ncbi:rhodanese-like domain-containing protein [Silicimonas algicola]|uniref:Rhodanese-related sulfurtransferase n=1 Tax=Silicimonas algicola TaxID=1826607 RepID=A0A316GA77_9RHOB|nr:rhodanese-like domain-containing protein [Silicimonas algicola]AZQ69515.1 rhodanese-like domain-containing protein [Silicimonas algicola]PWK56590.1 rhodanese-related sulfurtransferase [Silicimonas algicola]
MGLGSAVGEVSPGEAWRVLCDDDAARLIDVRTRAEWGFVGVPDLRETGQGPLFIEWASYPDMSVNVRFAEEVEKALNGEKPSTLLFLCRSGARSLKAAEAVSAHYARTGMAVTCLNVAEGFEGDVDASGHRGSHNGWKARGLAWRQS